MAATFFLPFGYDLLFKFLLDFTGSYAATNSIFYGISFTFFTIHICASQTNPVDEISKRAFETKVKILKLRSKI